MLRHPTCGGGMQAAGTDDAEEPLPQSPPPAAQLEAQDVASRAREEFEEAQRKVAAAKEKRKAAAAQRQRVVEVERVAEAERVRSEQEAARKASAPEPAISSQVRVPLSRAQAIAAGMCAVHGGHVRIARVLSLRPQARRCDEA